MTFLSLIGALLVEQWRPLRTGNRLYVAFARYVNRIGQNFNAGQYRDGVISWALAIIPVVFLTLVVYTVSRQVSWVIALAWNIVILYLALGFRQFSHFYNDIVLALKAGDIARAREIFALWRGESARELLPQEIAAPSSNEISSGSGTSVKAGTFMYGAWPPWPVIPYTTMPCGQSCDHPVRQCLQSPQPL